MSRSDFDPPVVARRARDIVGPRDVDGAADAYDDVQAGHVPTEDHEAHAPGKTCELCHRVIEAGQDARLRADGNWMHEACPIQ
ncbi:MAG TPA: hypothetical protein VEV45_23425 [Streptosporangiaceae bacterium]|nr:hypothetical protein [Streptosporangiaceae bacterium]